MTLHPHFASRWFGAVAALLLIALAPAGLCRPTTASASKHQQEQGFSCAPRAEMCCVFHKTETRIAAAELQLHAGSGDTVAAPLVLQCCTGIVPEFSAPTSSYSSVAAAGRAPPR